MPAVRLIPSREVNFYSLAYGLGPLISKLFLMLSFFLRFFYRVTGLKDSSSWFSPGQIKVSTLRSVWAFYLLSCFTYPVFFFRLLLNPSNELVCWENKQGFFLRVFWVQYRSSFSFGYGFSMNWFSQFHHLCWLTCIFVRLVWHRGLRKVC